MKLDIHTSSIEPRRQTYAHVARRLGDRPASRYDEAVLDVQATANFHYRPLWQPDREIYDVRRTAVVLEDWYVLRDPRQLYYGTYNLSRAAMDQGTERALAFIEQRGLLAAVAPSWLASVASYLLPLRHYEWGANMNAMTVADYGYGTAITSAAAFSAIDRLGMAQTLGKIGLLLDPTGDVLDRAKASWLEAPFWQPIRHALEDTFVLEDWFEAFVAQNVALDGAVHRLVYRAFDRAGMDHGAAAISMATGFMTEWMPDHARWVDAVVEKAAAASPENRALLSGWARKWSARAVEAARPLAERVLGGDAAAAVDRVAAEAADRAERLGLEREAAR
ncbi:MAG: hypothetical protein KIS78_08925 [Labilithrix sp.]|nr:hypothetical protein [Labilithrix sp.]